MSVTLDEFDSCIDPVKERGIIWINKMLESDITLTKPGSIKWLLFGEKPSEQSINIKLGKLGEYIAKEIIKEHSNLELLTCGKQKIKNKNKDIDLIWLDKINKIIYYRELKGNIELDTEKLPATIEKCKEIQISLIEKYTDYTINCGILNWSVYNRDILTAGLSNIKSFENGGIKIEHMKDFLEILNVEWPENDFYEYFKKLGNIIEKAFI